jgi:hypothetical protein
MLRWHLEDDREPVRASRDPAEIADRHKQLLVPAVRMDACQGSELSFTRRSSSLPTVTGISDGWALMSRT